MRIITEPTVTVVATSKFIEHPNYIIPPDGDDHTKIGSFAAKGCYDSYGIGGRSNTANQEQILSARHGSVLEHMNVSLFIEGITRGLTLELNRHRTFAISQRSTRYTEEGDSAVVLDPYYSSLYKKYNDFILDPTKDDIDGVPFFNLDELNLLASHIASLETALHAYDRDVTWLMRLNPLELTGFDLRKWARGKARNLLPHALETRATYTTNHRAWRWFIESRSSRHAEPEIRRLADVVLTSLRTVAPLYYQDFNIKDTYDGIPEWVPLFSKV